MGDDTNNISLEDVEQTARRDIARWEKEVGCMEESDIGEMGLKAANEKLRALNEDLAASNHNLQIRIEELSRVNKDLRSQAARRITEQEDERSRIARNLHDHLGQQLTALRLKLAAVRERDGNDSEVNRMLEQAGALAEQIDMDVDFLSWELRPPALDNFGLAGALAHFVEEWAKHFAITAVFHYTGPETIRFPQAIETNLYRIAQEALNNIYKHSRATRADVICECRADQVTLVIEDNGQGFADTAGEKGMGLIGMHERAALLGGALEIQSRQGDGTTIFVCVPSKPEIVAVEGVQNNEQNPRHAG
ncbi:MAG: sensor histidine kinase [Blastocatellia bacterium]|nr:sensor histidine kinase [Blastocatellia bacterium]